MGVSLVSFSLGAELQKFNAARIQQVLELETWSCVTRLREPLSLSPNRPASIHTAGLVSITSIRVVLHLLQLLLSLNHRLANPISKGHVSQSKRQQCSCNIGCRAPNGNLRSAIGHLPVIVRSRHRQSLTPIGDLPHRQLAPGRPVGPWGRPEMF